MTSRFLPSTRMLSFNRSNRRSRRLSSRVAAADSGVSAPPIPVPPLFFLPPGSNASLMLTSDRTRASSVRIRSTSVSRLSNFA